ncbi:MAG: hypothetical protein WC969_08270 [Elusimicrobiota bacterium]
MNHPSNDILKRSLSILTSLSLVLALPGPGFCQAAAESAAAAAGASAVVGVSGQAGAAATVPTNLNLNGPTAMPLAPLPNLTTPVSPALLKTAVPTPVAAPAKAAAQPKGRGLRKAAGLKPLPAAEVSPAPTAASKAAAQESLRKLGASLEEGKGSRKSAAQTSAELGTTYDNAKTRPDSDLVVQAESAGSAAPKSSRLAKSKQRKARAADAEEPPAPDAEPKTKSGVSPWLKIAAIGTVTLAAAAAAFFFIPEPVTAQYVAGGILAAGFTALGAIYYRSVRLNREWTKSKSAKDIARLDSARRSSDAAMLRLIADGASARRGRMEERIRKAKTARSDTVESVTKDSVKKAERLVAYDGLIVARGRLGENMVSKDPYERIGGELPGTWKERLAAEEGPAVETGFEGKLALQLKAMSAESVKTQRAVEHVRADIDAFEKVVPSLFGGELEKNLLKARRDLASVQKTELDAEKGLFTRTNEDMRGRVSDRLYSERADFKSHRDRYDRLHALHEQKVAPVVGIAEGIRRSLDDALSNLHSEQMNLALAAANTHVAVTKYRTVSDGKGGSRSESYIEYEDHSFMYRALAASAASSASSNISEANSALKRLPDLVSALAADETMKSEGLVPSLPSKDRDSVSGNMGGALDFFLPPLFGLFSSLSSESSVSSALNAFHPVLSKLTALQETVGKRTDDESGWVNEQISKDLEEQMSRVK